MKTNKDLIIERFREVERLGFVQSNRSHNTGIGKTFEDYIGVVENNADEPDLYGFEIKSHRELATSYVTLFTKAPVFPLRANTYLKDKYGELYPNNAVLKKLHVSMFASKYTLAYDKYNFKLVNDRGNSVVRIGIYNPENNQLIDNSVGYTYDCLDGILKKKLKNLFYVSAETKIIGAKEHFHFNKAEIFTNPS
ncbi:MAG: MvaI/BcnI restriction endonuclease family protein, partial [Muribaculaceae bacterium]|nr:MvaI/BcnI restriction endonuclease family protein [Muribaculaceae bacterium]